MNTLERAYEAASREQSLRADLEAYRRNVCCGRVERDNQYEDNLSRAIAAAEREWQEAMNERRAEREAA